jgi:Mn-dependent DtxR family transcriptional regulator
MNEKLFVTDYFWLLKIMKDHEARNKGLVFVPITQVEISRLLGINRVTVNQMIGVLKKEGYIKKEESRNSIYYLTEKADTVLKMIKVNREEL